MYYLQTVSSREVCIFLSLCDSRQRLEDEMKRLQEKMERTQGAMSSDMTHLRGELNNERKRLKELNQQFSTSEKSLNITRIDLKNVTGQLDIYMRDATKLKEEVQWKSKRYRKSEARGFRKSETRGYRKSETRGYRKSEARGYRKSEARGYRKSEARGYRKSEANATESLKQTDTCLILLFLT